MKTLKTTLNIKSNHKKQSSKLLAMSWFSMKWSRIIFKKEYFLGYRQDQTNLPWEFSPDKS